MQLAHAIDQCLAGDPSAYAPIVSAHLEGVVGLLRRLLGDREEARDVAQETFVRAYENLHRYDRRRSFKPWLLRIARNLAYNQLRARARSTTSGPRTTDRAIDQLPSEAPSPVGALLDGERRCAVDGVLASLRPEYREVLVYRYSERLDIDEIAAVMGIPEGTAKVWLLRARAQFRQRAAGKELF